MARETKTLKQKAPQTQVFTWEGRNRDGKKISGELTGRDIMHIRAQLRRQNITPARIRRKRASAFASLNKGTIKSSDITYFTRQLSTMVDAGVPIVQGMEIIGADQANASFKELLNTIRFDVEGGQTLSEALAKHPKYFDPLYISLIAVGEHAGVLDDVLQKLAAYREKIESIKAKVKKALIYPISIVTVAIVVTAILLIYVIPQFEEVFASAGTDLPVLTRIVINMSHFMREWGWLIGIGVVSLFIILFRSWKHSEKFQRFGGKVILRVPVIGKIMNQSALARFARTLETTFGAGVPIVDSLTSVSSATGNAIYADAVLRMRDGVTTGQSLNFAMSQEKLFPHMVKQMTAIGEESGSLDELLGKVADYYEEAVDNMVDSLSSLLEPMIIVVLGVVVGTMIVAMYMPIFQLGNVVG